jgi:hypothetical protein
LFLSYLAFKISKKEYMYHGTLVLSKLMCKRKPEICPDCFLLKLEDFVLTTSISTVLAIGTV